MFGDHFGLNIIKVDAEERFLSALAGIDEPEAKRKTIGRVFVNVFDDESKKLKNAKWLAQGTIYPDVIESAASKTGKAHVIKSHHNVGGLPEEMKMGLVEPLRELFKGRSAPRRPRTRPALRHALPSPLPGSGSGRARAGEVKKEYCDLLRKADAIFIEELRKADLYNQVSQAFAVFLPVRSVGVMGDGRKYDWVIALRARRDHRLYDRPLGSPAVRLPRPRVESHHQRDQRHLPRGVRRLRQTARNHRVGNKGLIPFPAITQTVKGALEAPFFSTVCVTKSDKIRSLLRVQGYFD